MARSNARLEVSGAGKTEDGLVQYNEEVNKLGDDLRELYETIRVNVDEEEQWKVFDFVEDFFMEELEIGDYINDINSYHLHMFDKHDVTTKKFDAIVEKAGKVDANYAAQIEGYCSLLGEYGKKFEAVYAMHALDLTGVKVFRYSDETAEAVASGEKLLKESGTIYESFADMMSPEDAKRYLDFLENGSREGLTSAELAGVEKADALLVSQKVGYEDVWDLRNVGDALESGKYSTQISPEMEKKILEGQRKSPVKNEVIGGHSPQINNSNDLFAVEELSVNADGTRNIKFVKDLQDGSISKIKKSTVFPDSWSDSKIIDTIKEVGDSPFISVRGRDGATWHRKIVDGVEVDVIKLGNDVISGYPTGKINAPKPSGF